MEFIVGLFCGCCLSFALFRIWVNGRSGRRAERIASGLDALLRSGRSMVTISNLSGGGPVVGVLDKWTGWSEQSFVDETIEDAIGEAVKCMNDRVST